MKKEQRAPELKDLPCRQKRRHLEQELHELYPKEDLKYLQFVSDHHKYPVLEIILQPRDPLFVRLNIQFPYNRVRFFEYNKHLWRYNLLHQVLFQLLHD